MPKLSDALDAQNPVQDSGAGDDPMSMGTSAVNYALYTVVALVGVTGGFYLFNRVKSITGATDVNVPVSGDL